MSPHRIPPMPPGPAHLALRLQLPRPLEGEAIALLWELGTTGVEECPLPPDRLELLAYFPARDSERMGEIGRALSRLSPNLGVEPAEVPDVDWVARFREGFRAFEVGPFQIVPSWQEAPDDRLERLLVDPGRAFGTGTHETTQLCLETLAELAQRGALGRVLDLGTGTGLLAVAASRLGGPSVVATDVDPEAVASAGVHAGLNDVQLHRARADGVGCFRDGVFDLILANLTAPLLLAQRDGLARVCAPGARLVLSGLLTDQLDEVRSAYAGLGGTSSCQRGEWASLLVSLA